MDNTATSGNSIVINPNAIATERKSNPKQKTLEDPALESIVDVIFKTIKHHSKSQVRNTWKIPNLNFWNAKVKVGDLNFNFTYGDIIKTVFDTRDIYNSLNSFNRNILNRIRNKYKNAINGYRFRYNQLIKIHTLTLTQQGNTGSIPFSNLAMPHAMVIQPATAIQPAMAIQPAINSPNITNNNSSIPADLPNLLCIDSNEIFYSSLTLSPSPEDTMDFTTAISNNTVPIPITKFASAVQLPCIMHRPLPVKFTSGVGSAFRSNQNKTISDLRYRVSHHQKQIADINGNANGNANTKSM